MQNESARYEVRFEEVSVAEAGVLAANLRDELLEFLPEDAKVLLEKDDPTNQDFGATLVLVLGTPAVLAIARGIASYLQRQHGSISISKDGAVVATGISGADAARIAEAFSTKAQ
jgi:hypothetical protein